MGRVYCCFLLLPGGGGGTRPRWLGRCQPQHWWHLLSMEGSWLELSLVTIASCTEHSYGCAALGKPFTLLYTVPEQLFQAGMSCPGMSWAMDSVPDGGIGCSLLSCAGCPGSHGSCLHTGSPWPDPDPRGSSAVQDAAQQAPPWSLLYVVGISQPRAR